jgi:hypothetical protein
MFEITRDDIAALNDEDLRTLIGLLCEAELRRANLPVSAATWGGDQTAKDGGLDLRVALPPGTKIEGFIPRAATGFQVKKPDMPPSEIPKEMKPKGVVRPPQLTSLRPPARSEIKIPISLGPPGAKSLIQKYVSFLP